MIAPNRAWIFECTKHALQRLACPAEMQIQLIPSFACAADEMALGFDHWAQVFIGNFRSEFTTEQIASLTSIDEKFDLFSGEGKGFNEEFWTDDGLRDSPEWENIRHLAEQALRLFGWPIETPPSYAHEFVEGERNVKNNEGRES
jgi:hypothetical protein